MVPAKFELVDFKTPYNSNRIQKNSTRDLAPKAKVLRCRQPSPYKVASRGVAHQWGGGDASWGVAGLGGGGFMGVGTFHGERHIPGMVDFGPYLVDGWQGGGIHGEV